MPKTILLCCLLLGLSARAQPGINTRLKAELDSLLTADQTWRDYVTLLFNPAGRDSVATLLKVSPDTVQQYVIQTMNRSDSLNMERLSGIIRQYGYPGKSLVGTPTNEAAFFIIQHSTRIDTYLPIVKEAAQKKELAFSLYAMMLDRYLMYHEKEQVYGTQIRGFEMTNPATGQKEWKTLIWPIKNSKGVARRRKKAGFSISLEEYAKRMGVSFTLYSLAEVKQMMGTGH